MADHNRTFFSGSAKFTGSFIFADTYTATLAECQVVRAENKFATRSDGRGPFRTSRLNYKLKLSKPLNFCQNFWFRQNQITSIFVLFCRDILVLWKKENMVGKPMVSKYITLLVLTLSFLWMRSPNLSGIVAKLSFLLCKMNINFR